MEKLFNHSKIISFINMLQLRLEVTGPDIASQSSNGSVGFQPTLEIDLIKGISRDTRRAALSKSAALYF